MRHAVVRLANSRALDLGDQLIETGFALFRQNDSLPGNRLVPMAMTADARRIKDDVRIRGVHDATRTDSGNQRSFPFA